MKNLCITFQVRISNLRKFLPAALLALVLLAPARGQETFLDSAGKYRDGISGKLNSLLAGGVVFDAFLTPRVNAEVSGSLFLTFGGEAGINYHWFKKPPDLWFGNWSPYIGLHAGYYELHFLVQTDYALLYIPVGIQHLNHHRLSMALDAGYSLQRISDYHQGDFNPYKIEFRHLPHGRIKLGYRF